MTGKKPFAIFLIYILLLTSQAMAINISASIDKSEAIVGEQIHLKISITGAGGTVPDPILPNLADFEVYSAGRSQNVSIVNGAFSSALDLNYILVPKKAGEFIIGPVVIKDRNSMYSTEPIKVAVKAQTGAGRTPSSQGQRNPTGARNLPSKKGEDFFIEQSVDKMNPYLGEQVVLTLKFYQALTLYDQPALSWPDYSGLSVDDLPPNSRYYEVVNGRRYLVTDIKRALFPISAGEIKVESPTITIQADDFGVNFDPFSFFDRNMRDLFKRGEPKILQGNQIILKAKPLPGKNRPSSFSGAVGGFDISAQVDKDSVGVDEPVTLKIVLTGNGNVKSLVPVKLPELSDFRIYESGSSESISNSNLVISGSKTFEHALIPKTSGKFTIPAIEFSYFEPSRGGFRTAKTEPIMIIATGEGLADVGGAPKNIIGSKGRSFAYIVTEFPKPRKSFLLSDHWWFWCLQLLPALLMAVAFAYRIHQNKLLGDSFYARSFGASRKAQTLMLSAMKKKRAGDYEGCLADIYDAILGFVADKKGLEKTGLTIDHLNVNITIESNLKKDLVTFIEITQAHKYAMKNLGEAQLNEIYENSRNLLKLMEKSL